MNYRALGNTGLRVSEIGLGGEWLEKQDQEAVTAIIRACEAEGINILDCWMSNPDVRTHIGNAIEGHRENWIIQGHIGSTWQDGQYVRTRDVDQCRAAFEDLLARFKTDYIDLGMIHYCDSEEDYEAVMNGPFIDYVKELKAAGKIRHIGVSSHNPEIAAKFAASGIVEMMLFSVNPAFDMVPPTDNVDNLFGEEYFIKAVDQIAPERVRLYQLCEERGVGITVMKAYAGGRLLDADASPFKTALTPVQCLHYALTRPAVSSILVGFSEVGHLEAARRYESADAEEKDYATVLANAPLHRFASGQCTYCGHCKPCPVNIDIAMVNKFLDLALMQKETPESVRSHYTLLDAHAADCLRCGSCESRCPFGVKVTDRMAKAEEVFGL